MGCYVFAASGAVASAAQSFYQRTHCYCAAGLACAILHRGVGDAQHLGGCCHDQGAARGALAGPQCAAGEDPLAQALL